MLRGTNPAPTIRTGPTTRQAACGQVLRYASAKDPAEPVLDGYTNFHHVTDAPGHRKALLESGINGVATCATSVTTRPG